MGNCASCLGLNRRSSSSDPSDTSQLLAEHYQPGYGSISAAPPGHAGHTPDPEEIRRQRDALERICAQTSDKLIDVSQAAYQSADPSEDPAQSRNAEFARLFAERFPPRHKKSGGRSDTSSGAEGHEASGEREEEEDEATWLAKAMEGNEEDVDGVPHWDRVKPLKEGTLTIQFDEMLAVAGKGRA